MMKRKLNNRPSPVFLLALLLLPAMADAGWQMVWNDEFAQADGSSPDGAKWGYETGGGGWGNAELENYTPRTNNARIENGQMVIEARAENYGGSSYTSARLLTRGKWSWTYGRMEARIKIPRGQGIWPAFWMLGDNIGSAGWPACGEIDIMENIGKEPKLVHGTVHGPGYSGGGGIGGPYALSSGADFADDFHLYAVEWSTNQIKWFVDGQQFFSVTPANLNGNTWVFTQPQFILLNVAVGGQWPGNPDGTTVFPQQMLVDYVRVYHYVAAPPAPVPVAIQSGGLINWPTTPGTTWTLQSGPDGVTWSNRAGPAAGNGNTNSLFDPLWPAQNQQYQILETTFGAGNLVVNSGFETGSGLSMSNWIASGSQPPVRISTNSHGGQFSLSLAVTNPVATPNSSQMDQNVVSQGSAPVVPGQTYSLSFWAWQVSSGVSLVQNYRLTWLNSSGVNLGDSGWIGFTGGNGSWKQISTTNLVAPPNAANAQVTIYATTGAVAHGYGNVLIDDVSLSYATAGQTNLISAAVRPGVQIAWPGASGSFYDVQRTDDLVAGSWSNLVSAIAGTGGTNTVTDLINASHSRFYRVVE